MKTDFEPVGILGKFLEKPYWMFEFLNLHFIMHKSCIVKTMFGQQLVDKRCQA